MYFNCCSRSSFEAEIIKISQSSYKMYSNKKLNFQESTTILDAHTKKVWKLIVCASDLYLRISNQQNIPTSQEYYRSLLSIMKNVDLLSLKEFKAEKLSRNIYIAWVFYIGHYWKIKNVLSLFSKFTIIMLI